MQGYTPQKKKGRENTLPLIFSVAKRVVLVPFASLADPRYAIPLQSVLSFPLCPVAFHIKTCLRHFNAWLFFTIPWPFVSLLLRFCASRFITLPFQCKASHVPASLFRCISRLALPMQYLSVARLALPFLFFSPRFHSSATPRLALPLHIFGLPCRASASQSDSFPWLLCSAPSKSVLLRFTPRISALGPRISLHHCIPHFASFPRLGYSIPQPLVAIP